MKSECDIVLLSYESPDLLRRCVQSVLDHTKVRATLIIVDNGSKDPKVARFLQAIHGNKSVTIEKIFSENNAGFAAGMNKGMRLSDAPYVCILNNDCVVTEGWLEEMMKVAASKDNIGLVNPQSNTFGSRPDGNISIGGHASLIRNRSGKYIELGHAIGFACLIKREVIQKIGFLDEIYQGVCYEDTDYSVRASNEGYIPVIAEAAYVYHVEQASRGTMKGKEQVYKRNRHIFEDKWGRLLRVFLVFDEAGTEDGKLTEVYETLKLMARQRIIVDLRISQGRLAREVALGFDRRDMINHADISINTFSDKVGSLALLWKVLTKKKKYDAIIMKEGLMRKIFDLFKPVHKGEIFTFTEKGNIKNSRGEEFSLNEPKAIAERLRA